jgi:6-pyruvoyltetrahydropterin/6-carboxytetrahydropterin synthase
MTYCGSFTVDRSYKFLRLRYGNMYELKIITQFGAAHQIKDIGGKCEDLHGHNWKIEVYVMGPELGKDGLLIDFKVIKTATEKVIDRLDHKFLNELEYFKDINPSSENIACYIYEALARELDCDNVKISRVAAWESDSACATYMGS